MSPEPKPMQDYSAERRAERYAAYNDLVIQYEGRSLDIPVRVPDISRTGMFINTASVFPEGTVLKLSFKLSRSQREIKTRAEVRYCLPGVGLGVEFIDISEQDQEAIDLELRS